MFYNASFQGCICLEQLQSRGKDRHAANAKPNHKLCIQYWVHNTAAVATPPQEIIKSTSMVLQEREHTHSSSRSSAAVVAQTHKATWLSTHVSFSRYDHCNQYDRAAVQEEADHVDAEGRCWTNVPCEPSSHRLWSLQPRLQHATPPLQSPPARAALIQQFHSLHTAHAQKQHQQHSHDRPTHCTRKHRSNVKEEIGSSKSTMRTSSFSSRMTVVMATFH